MNVWEVIFLGIMATALVGMAIAQVILAREATRMMRQAADTLQEFRREIQPIVEKLQRVTDDVGKTTQLARLQVERVDRIMGSTAERIDETMSLIQGAILQPIRQSSAMLAGVRAAFSVFQGGGRRAVRAVRDEDDALFIG